MNSAIELKQDQAFDFLLNVAVVRPVFIWGAPGIGKSALVNRFSAEVGMECVSLLGSRDSSRPPTSFVSSPLSCFSTSSTPRHMKFKRLFIR
jgi:hypothetical protein